MTKTQLRGICQCCGRQQAVLAGTGLMSKHGYTVDHGWFQGVCSGQRYAPLQKDRAQADRIIAQVRAEAAKLATRAKQYRDGTAHPAQVSTGRWDAKTRTTVMVSWEEAAPYQRERGVESEVFRLESRSRQGFSFATALENLADVTFGTELVEVPVEAGLAPILVGEVRVGDNGRKLTVSSVQGARVYWKDERGFKGWTGVQAWREKEQG